jgi:hypothetical protein
MELPCCAGVAVVSGAAQRLCSPLLRQVVLLLAEESNKRNTKRINVIKSAHLGFAVGNRNVPALSFCFRKRIRYRGVALVEAVT